MISSDTQSQVQNTQFRSITDIVFNVLLWERIKFSLT